MTYTTVALSKKYEHRYKFIASIYSLEDKKYTNATVFLDTGCFNTMIPKILASKTGKPLGFKKDFTIGGKGLFFKIINHGVTRSFWYENHLFLRETPW